MSNAVLFNHFIEMEPLGSFYRLLTEPHAMTKECFFSTANGQKHHLFIFLYEKPKSLV